MERDYLIIAVDFDGTLVEDKYPHIGKPLIASTSSKTLIEELKLLKIKGHKIILWTCRTGVFLNEAVGFCKDCGLEFDAINDDLDENKVAWGESLRNWKKSGKARKIYADIYLDDRAFNTNCQRCLSSYLSGVSK